MAYRSISVFPLPLVIIQGEEVRLHIFESRYKNLVRHCVSERSSFVIPMVFEGQLQYSGAEVEVEKVIREYPGGEMDIICRAIARVRVQEYYESASANIASTALITIADFLPDEDKELSLRLQDLLLEFYSIAGIQAPFEAGNFAGIHEVYHKCGLSTRQEMDLADLGSTRKRQYYLIEHLKRTIPVLQEVENMKSKIRMNGHFKKLSQSK